MPPDIIIEDLSLSIDDHRIIENLSVEIPSGSFFSILGRSGAGKTTILKAIAGVILPQSGIIRSSEEISIPNRIAYMAQEDLLLPWLSVEKNVVLGARLRGSPPDRARARHLLEAVGLGSRHDARPSQLSGGMRQRVALARTLYEDQPIVLMDEPFSALDYVTRLSVQSMAARLLRDKTVVLVTHDVAEACRLSSHIYVLDQRIDDGDRLIVLPGKPPREAGRAEVQEAERRTLALLLGSTGA